MDPEKFFGMSLGLVAILALFVFLPWIILHYTARFKANSRLTAEDETMLEELYELARRLDDRMMTLERILADENPNWNPLAGDRAAARPRLAVDEVEELETELRSRKADLSKRRRA